MAELTAAAGVRGGREWSPDSVIFALESNLSSLFSSASASVGRCSAASDPHDADSLSSAFSPHLAGHESGGPDLDLPSSSNKSLVLSSYRGKKVEKAKVEREEDNNRVALHLDGDDFQALSSHSARNSFSIALKECQERRSKSEALINKLQRRRPASLDLNSSLANVVSSSPRLGPMKKTETSATATTAVSCRKSGNFPSPGTPNYHHGSVGINKGWSSERVPLPNNGNRRQMGASLLPLHNGRTLPSKWEDAERWIFSPVAGDGVGRPSYQQPQRRPKSKSGPLGPPGMAYYSLYSPAFPIYSGGNVNNITGGSPFSAGVMVADESSVHAEGGLGQSFASVMDSCIARSASVHGYTDLVVQSSLTSSNDDKVDGVKDAATEVSPVVSKRDMATQMSHNCPRSSSRRRPSFPPSSSSILPIVEVQSFSSPKSQVRDVEIDERVTVTRWPMKDRARNTASGSEDVDNWKLQAEEPRSSAWEVSETVKSISKVKREEAKIAAWENLQKAKAEAALRKLEMKLEKKRSSSLDKIMKKLRSAQKKAQEMRSVVSANQSKQACKSSSRAISFRRTRQMGSLSGCFTCHAF